MNLTVASLIRLKFARSRTAVSALVLSGLLFSAIPSWGGLKIYYIRHGQTGANVAKQWESTAPEKRPDYVGDANRFTPLGELQVAAVPDKLDAYQFDFVAVSPKWRTRHTILPYLAKKKIRAEIWPELSEFSRGSEILGLLGEPDLPSPEKNLLNGNPITISDEKEREWLFLLTPDAREPKLRDATSERAADVAQLQKIIVDRIRQRFGGSDASILLVGHGSAGRALLRTLTGYPQLAQQHIANTGVWMVEEQADGSFKLQMLNDKPFEKK